MDRDDDEDSEVGKAISFSGITLLLHSSQTYRDSLHFFLISDVFVLLDLIGKLSCVSRAHSFHKRVCK